MRNLNTVDVIALILVIIGGLNWGLVGFLDLDIVATLFAPLSLISRIIYVLVGLAAIYLIVIFGSLGRKS